MRSQAFYGKIDSGADVSDCPLTCASQDPVPFCADPSHLPTHIGMSRLAKILVVDDEDYVRNLIKAFLKDTAPSTIRGRALVVKLVDTLS